MGSGIALDDAAIMSTVLEAILYGFSLLMFIGTIWVLTHNQSRNAPNLAMIAVAIVLLILSTAHMVIDILRIDEGLVKYRNIFPGGPVAYFGDVAQYTFVVKNAIYTLQTLVGDSVVIYRCYVVWQSIWIIILPSMLWCGVAATGIASVYNVSQATTNASNIFAKETGQWITAFYGLTLATSLLSSGILAYRIWSIERGVASVRASGTLVPIIRVLIDAAGLYAAALFTTLMCFVNANNGQYVVLDLITPIISIAFYMVLIRIAMKRNSKNLHYSSASRGRIPGVESQGSAYGMRPLQVYISQSAADDSATNRELGKDHLDSMDKGEREGVTYAV